MGFFEAIGNFFSMIWRGILAFFCGIWWVIKTVAVAIFNAIVYLIGLMVRYFFVYLPVVIMAGFAIFWILNPEGPEAECILPMDLLLNKWGYNFNITLAAVEWMENTEVNILFLIIFLFKIVVIVVAAIFEFIVIYLIFGLVGSLIAFVIYFILMIAIFFVLPAAAVVYSGFMIKNSDSYNRWFYFLCTILTIVCTVICYIYAFGAL